ncbi:hypothetical protein LI951_07090 [Enterococcus sp. BWT-B8]|uniref:hypothetical protein n=1 Tax=Enterococcus sp. BWT-B8 TaxID=2885157 RepID=UPI001E48D18C|nr:hypothetical protein [Enterococcus sp. BWT-B8]MCB5951825.1 hypothetical protein [Enterococcus sp. BWT-B8]
MASKLANIGIAIGGMSVLVGVVGALVASGIGALIAGAGLATIYLVAEELIHMSEAIKEMDQNVPEEMTGVKEKIEGIAEAVGYFTAADLGGVLDLLENAVGALNTAVAAEGIKKLVEVGLELEKLDGITIPEDVEAKINAIQDVFGYLKKGVGLIGELNQFFNGGGIDTKIGDKASQAISNLVDVAEAAKKLAGVNMDELENVDGTIQGVQGLFGMFEKTKGLKTNFKEFFEGGDIGTGVAKDAKNYVKSITDIATSFEKLENAEFDINTVKTKIEGIQSVFDLFLEKGNIVDRFKSLFTGENSIDTGLVKTAKEYVTNLAAIAGELAKIQDAELIFGDVKTKLQNIQDIVKEFAKIDLKMDLDSNSLNDTVTKAGLVNDLINHLETALNFTFDTGALDKFKETMKNVAIAIKEILTADFVPKENNGKEIKIPSWKAMKAKVDEAIEKLTELNLLGTQISNALQFKFNADNLTAFQTTIKLMKDVIREVLTTNFSPEDSDGNKLEFDNWEEIKQPILDAIDKLTELNNLGKQLDENLNFDFDGEKIKQFKETLKQLKAAYQAITTFDLDFQMIDNQSGQTTDGAEYQDQYISGGIFTGGNNSQSSDNNSANNIPNAKVFEKKVNDTITQIDKISELKSAFETLVDGQVTEDELQTALTNLQNNLVAVQNFVTSIPEIGDIDLVAQSLEKINAIAEAIVIVSEQFKEVGVSYATTLLQGFDSVGIPAVLTVKLIALALFLRGGSVSTQFYEVGKFYGNKLQEGFSSALNRISSKLNEVASTIETNVTGSSAIASFKSVGTSLGNALVAGFKSVIEGLYVKVSATNGSGSNIINDVGFATGGLVPSYLASGGLASIFKKRGTDTVPAMLTPGEFVQRKAAVNTFGLDFMKRVNSLDVRGAFNALTGRFNTSGMLTPAVSSIVNNVNHTTNNANRVTQNVVGGNPDYMMKRASRYLR